MNRILHILASLVLLISANLSFADESTTSLAATKNVAGKTFTYCFNPNWKPYDYNDNGKPSGIFMDYVQLLAQRMGIHITPHFTPNWSASLDAIKKGECDFLLGAVKTPEREAFLDFTAPYYDAVHILIAKKEKPFIGSLSSLSGKTICGAKNSAMMKQIAQDYPLIKQIDVETTEEATRVLRSGKADACVGSLDQVATELGWFFEDSKIIGKIDYPYPISIAVRKGMLDLQSAFDHAINSINDADRAQIMRRWSFVNIEENVDYGIIWKTLGGSILLISLFFFWNRRLQKEITKRKKVESELIARTKALEDASLRLKLSLQAARLGVWEWQVETAQNFVDDAWLEMLGYQRSEFEETISYFHGLVHPEDIDRLQTEFEQFETGNNNLFESEFRIRSKNGSWCWVDSGGIVTERDQAGKIKRMVGVHLNITDRKQAETAKQSFVSMVSHELRTPLSAIIGMNSRLLTTSLNKQQKEYAEKISSSSELLLLVINEILDFEKISAGKLTIQQEPFVLTNVIDQTIDIVQVATTERNLTLRVDIDESIPKHLIGDELRLKQILLNLANNAAKFTEIGGITISARCKARNANYCEVLFSVRDTGIGITKQNLEKVFNPFFQADSFITRREGGTGLGLSICHQLVELMGGKIWVDSELGKGSEFQFSIPFAFGPEVESDTQPATLNQVLLQTGLRGKRILIVEDNLLNRQVAFETLSDAGMVIEVATNGEEAIIKARQFQPEAILMDLQLPIMDGIEATRLIRKFDAFKYIPIIALTAHSSISTNEINQDSGFSEYLIKPVQPSLLYDTLLRHLKPNVIPWLSSRSRSTENYSSIDVQLPGIDINAALKMTNGNLDRVMTRLCQFVEDMDSMGQQIRSSFTQSTQLETRSLIHSLKGASGNVGAIRLHELATLLLKNTSAQDQSVLIDKIVAELELLKSTAKSLLIQKNKQPGLTRHTIPSTEDWKTLGSLVESDGYIPEELLDRLESGLSDPEKITLMTTLRHELARYRYATARQLLKRLNNIEVNTNAS